SDLGTATADNHLVARTVRAAGAALQLAPWGHWVAATGRAALTTTVRVVDRVHSSTADGRAPALPAHTAGLAPADVDLLLVTDLADGCTATDVDAANLGGRHTQDCVLTLLTQQLDRSTSGAGHLGAATWLQLDAVDGGTSRDVTQRQVVTNLDVCVRAGLDQCALLQATRSDDVALLAVAVVQQCDVCGAVRVVLDVKIGRASCRERR